MTMIRSAKYTLKFATNKKKNYLNQLFDIYVKYLQKTIDLMWNKQIPIKKKLSSKKITWMDDLGGQYKNLIYQHASRIVRSCRFKKGKKPVIKNPTITFDARMVNIEKSHNTFDKWIRLKLPFIKDGYKNRRIEILIPLKEHRHSLKFKDWELVKSVRINRDFVTLIFKKETPKPKENGKIIGIDIGYKYLIATSEGELIGSEMERIYEKIARKRQGSKAFKRALIERDNKINEIINKNLDLSNVKILKVEDLKNVKKNSHGRIRRKFNNKLQRWSYPKVIDKLKRACEEEAVQFLRVRPAYTSITCPRCQFRHKSNRIGEKFKCRNCGYVNHADIVGAINVANWEPIVPNAPKTSVQEQISIN